MAQISIDFLVDDTAASLVALATRLRLPAGFGTFPTATGPSEDLCLNLTNCGYLGPMAVSFLVGLKFAFVEHGKTLTIIPPQDQRLRAYLAFSGLLAEFGLDGEPEDDHPSSETIRFRTFQAIDMTALQKVIRLVHRHVILDPDTEDMLRTVMMELMQNIFDHSGAIAGGTLAARAFVKQRMDLRIAICDTGVGIRKTLSKKHRTGSDREALLKSIEEGVSGKSIDRNMGMGLNVLRDIARQQGGKLVLGSGSAALSSTSRNIVTETQVRIPGTVALFSIPIDL